jgi:signal transduction histidine kinase
VAEGPFGIRLLDVGIVALVIAAIEINVIVGTGPGAVPLNVWAYLDGALLAVPILFRHRWPFQVMIACAVLIFLYYIFARRNISPAPVFFVPLYDATVAGYLIWAVTIAAGFMITGLVVVEVSTSEGLATLFADFLSQIVILALAVTVGEVVRSRQALAAETARRLLLAEEERAAESGRVVAEERLRIARELHDTVAHSMATITVQAGSALHLLGGGTGTGKPPHDPGLGSPAPSSGRGADADKLRAALTAIRETSKGALTEMRSVLGQLRRSDPRDPGLPDDAGPPGADAAGQTGLDRLPALQDAVTEAGATVTVTVEGERLPLSAQADHSAYRILQESLTNVLRHAPPGAVATVCLRYQPDVLTITVTDSGGPRGSGGDGSPPGSGGPGGPGGHGGAGSPPVIGGSWGVVPPDRQGHGIRGMRERAAAVGGELTAGPLPGGGFQVRATLPTATQATADAATRQAADVPARGESS